RHNIIKGFEKEQLYLFPVNVMEWLPENDVVYVILSILDLLDLSAFLSKYRSDGIGSAFYNPRSMLGIIIYAMIRGEPSSRKIEISCRYDIGYRIVAQGLQPDHTTIFRFKQNNAQEIKGIFKQLARIIVESKITRIGILAIDGTKIGANASLSANRKAKNIEAELKRIFNESLNQDEQETIDGTTPVVTDYNLPDELATKERRREVLQKALDKLNERQEIEAEKQKALIRDREREEEETGQKKRGRKPSEPQTVPSPDAKVNVTDPTSQVMSTSQGFIQGFNGQIVVTEDQLIIAAALTDDQNDKNQLQPMMDEVNELLKSVQTDECVEAVVADSGYCSMQTILSETPNGPQLYLATSKERKFQDAGPDEGFRIRLEEVCRPVPGSCSPTIPELASIGAGVWHFYLDREKPATPEEVCWEIMGARVRSPSGREIYRKRKIMVEPVFGNIKHNMRLRRFSLKGKNKCEGEFALAAMCHNIIKIKCNNLLGKLLSFFRDKSISVNNDSHFRQFCDPWKNTSFFLFQICSVGFMRFCQISSV
ncbi:MAG: transposase, partial [Methanoregula sp.]|nr:transposase [Methanoregula sp.]